MIKVLVRDDMGTPQCLVFWRCLRAEAVVIGSTYMLSIVSSAAVKESGVPKKNAKPDTKYYASYGSFEVTFNSVAEFVLLKGLPVDNLREIAPHEATISPSLAMRVPIGVASVLVDVTGLVLSCFGRKDKTKASFCDVVLADAGNMIRVRASSCRALAWGFYE
jgi:hypothetical protein